MYTMSEIIDKALIRLTKLMDMSLSIEEWEKKKESVRLVLEILFIEGRQAQIIKFKNSMDSPGLKLWKKTYQQSMN